MTPDDIDRHIRELQNTVTAAEQNIEVWWVYKSADTRPRYIGSMNRHRSTAEQHIKEGKNAVTWTRLSCQSSKANAVRLQLHALAYNLANFLRTLALPEEVKQWSMTTLGDRLVKIGAKIVRTGAR